MAETDRMKRDEKKIKKSGAPAKRRKVILFFAIFASVTLVWTAFAALLLPGIALKSAFSETLNGEDEDLPEVPVGKAGLTGPYYPWFMGPADRSAAPVSASDLGDHVAEENVPHTVLDVIGLLTDGKTALDDESVLSERNGQYLSAENVLVSGEDGNGKRVSAVLDLYSGMVVGYRETPADGSGNMTADPLRKAEELRAEQRSFIRLMKEGVAESDDSDPGKLKEIDTLLSLTERTREFGLPFAEMLLDEENSEWIPSGNQVICLLKGNPGRAMLVYDCVWDRFTGWSFLPD